MDPLSKFNGKTGAWIKNVYIPYSGLLQLAVDKDGRMYGGYYWSNYIAVFNPETGAAIATHYTPNRGYVAGVFWDGEYLWFGERLGSGNKYYRVDVSGGGWNIINTFTSNFNSYGFGMGVVGNMLLISNSTSDSFLYHTNLDLNNNTMTPTYKVTPNQSWGLLYLIQLQRHLLTEERLLQQYHKKLQSLQKSLYTVRNSHIQRSGRCFIRKRSFILGCYDPFGNCIKRRDQNRQYPEPR